MHKVDLLHPGTYLSTIQADDVILDGHSQVCPGMPKYRPSQIACMVMTVHVTCTQKALRRHENSFTVLILLCKNNLNLPISHTDNYPLKK